MVDDKKRRNSEVLTTVSEEDKRSKISSIKGVLTIRVMVFKAKTNSYRLQ